MKKTTIKQKPIKGVKKEKSDNDNPEKNPLLHIENKKNFSIETSNLLETTDALLTQDFESFDLTKDKDHLDIGRLTENSVLLITLRYFEYLCTARFTFEYMLPLLNSELTAKDVFEMVKHCLKNKLLCNVPSFDTIFEPEFQYKGKIKY